MKYHGLKINMVDANTSAAKHGGKFAGNLDKESKASPPSLGGGPAVAMPPGAASMGMPMDMKSFFGGSFFSQLDSDSKQEIQAYLATASDKEIVKELA